MHSNYLEQDKDNHIWDHSSCVKKQTLLLISELRLIIYLRRVELKLAWKEDLRCL